MDKKTINLESNLGKRLNQIKKIESRHLLFMGKEISLVSKITLGRDERNSVVVDDKMVSRFHAVIQKIKEDYFIKDLKSSNGTFVNNEPVPAGKYVKLGKDDVIRLGKNELKIV
jgi:pSer/pThr/pTyr-binding forkhead associated (FHA) protein